MRVRANGDGSVDVTMTDLEVLLLVDVMRDFSEEKLLPRSVEMMVAMLESSVMEEANEKKGLS